ncbi:GCN5-related N-acetyltransferase [Candidatus Koribacter versatilis Ellin345]|uniref:GCN5-related N-acetyltransferase n=1 Tax=Koribacter versatilis (strain Ellin345) TaxID=204669 RepID=Q1ISG0_KORVE|nr:GNAT family N-acetyltransferase [Candidatus Koribacter versatilis]ABF40190.1 GCN5-related N-acetyltransferase [Candidatus Koribacter versatilis Ellin345]
MPIEIRIANAADIPAMLGVINAAFAIETFLEGQRADAARIEEMMEKGKFFVVLDNGEIVASIYVEPRGERSLLAMLAVHPKKQGSPLAFRLARAAEAHCREQGCKFADITVLSQRTELPPVYERFGYRLTGTKEFESTQQLKDGVQCHTLLLTKEL